MTSKSPSSLMHLLPSEPAAGPRRSRLLTPTTQPIPLLPTRAARTYGHVHTGLVVGACLLTLWMGVLVRDPMGTMGWGLFGLGVLQVGWCVGSVRGWEKEREGVKEGKGGAGGRKKGGGMGWGTRVMPALISLILALVLPPLPLTILALILGAPLYPSTLLPYTLLLSTHVSLLAFQPLFYAHGVSGPAWRDVLAAWLPFDEAGVWGGTVGCLVGGWVGAVPMALDWDREWQRWPVTVLVGCYMGWGVGRVVTGLGWGVGRRIDLSEGDEVEGVVRRGVAGGDKKMA